MKPQMKSILFLSTLAWCGVQAAPGETGGAPGAASGQSLEAQGWDVGLKSGKPVNLPTEGIFRLRVPIGGSVTVKAVTETPSDKPLLQADFKLSAVNSATVQAWYSGAPMIVFMRSVWSHEWSEELNGSPKDNSLPYAWRFLTVNNLWDESDRRDIGAAYADLVPFVEKDFFLRMVLVGGTRQIWLDDRLVSEERVANPATARFELQTSGGAQVISANLTVPHEKDGFVPVPLAHYSHNRQVRKSAQPGEVLDLKSPDGRTIPFLASLRPGADVDLGESLYRYRMTKGTGPDVGYVEATHADPNAFQVDPARLSFRVPYREYQTAWLLAWMDDDDNSIPRGNFRFYDEAAGFPASTDFEITKEAMKQKLVTKLPNRTADGKPLYLIRVPVDSDGFYGFRDSLQRVIDFELSKPVMLTRGYPDPIYHGIHPSGLPSSIHVVGITLEQAPFDYEVKPQRVCHVFERPDAPAYKVSVTNRSQQPLEAKVSLMTRSFDKKEEQRAEGKATVAPGATSDVALNFDLKKNGWHELKARVEAGGVVRENTLSLVVLPPNTRTYGDAANETRFGNWSAGHFYSPLHVKQYEWNEEFLTLLRKLGIRRMVMRDVWFHAEKFKSLGFSMPGPHTIGSRVYVPFLEREKDPAAWQKALDEEIKEATAPISGIPQTDYFYGAEWGISLPLQYGPWPLYTGEGDRELTPEERKASEQQAGVFAALGRAIRAKSAQTKLILNWGSPLGTLGYIRGGMPKELVDKYGFDLPMFDMVPEMPQTCNSVQALWELRAETKRLGWPALPVAWCEGPCVPTCYGTLTEEQQAANLVRIWLAAIAFGVDQFDCGILDFDPGNWYRSEQYGAGSIFRYRPLACPKVSCAAVATATAMLCGADAVGGVDTGCPTTYCLAFQRAKTKEMIYALWRVEGAVEATLKVKGQQAILTDAMGNATPLPITDGAVKLSLSSTPVWLTGLEKIEGFEFGAPAYDSAPAKITRPLAEMTAKNWEYDGADDTLFSKNHFINRRIIDKNLKAEFGAGEENYKDAVAITLPEEPGNAPLAIRFGALVARKPIVIPGKASALGVWIKGNSSWGRIVYKLRDAKGEVWLSAGTKDDWNCDDPRGWSWVTFEGWRYVRFPLPSSAPYDTNRETETTWWGSTGGDGIVDLPLKIEKIYVEARNEAVYLGEMKPIKNRSYKLSGLVAEYVNEEDVSNSAIALSRIRRPMPEWSGPSVNLIAKLAAEGVGEAPSIQSFTEPFHGPDGRSMIIHFPAAADLKYKLYLGRYEDGRGADLLLADVKDAQTVAGLRPETEMYLFLTSVNKDNQESKPSKAFKLITHDKFLEK